MSDIAATVPSPIDPTLPESAPVEPAVESPRRGRLERFSDRLNPILVREVHQALNGKAVVITASLALLAILTIALLIAAQDEVSPRDGADAFLNTLMVLIPILMFIVPFQAFFSMRSEVGSGTVEHLLMSRLSPSRIVRGKLLAATVQFAIYMAIFSPLLAMTFLLRGVDVPTIAVMLTLAFIMALSCSALAIACGALCRWRSFFRAIPFAIVLIGLSWATGGSMAMLEEIVRELPRAFASKQFLLQFSSMALVPLVATIFFAMIASSALAHPYENRSTRFRVFAFGFVILMFGWTIYTYYRSHAAGFTSFLNLGRQLIIAGTMCGGVLCLFPFFAATEAPSLSPRVRMHVPRRRWLAVLVAPLLPGCGRGLLFTILLTALVLLGARFLPSFFGDESAPRSRYWQLLVCVWLYIVFFAGVGCWIRGRLSDAETRNWWARGILPVLLMVSVLLPLLVSVAGGRSVMSRWNPLHLLNPFYTISYLRGRESEIMSWLVPITALVVLINLGAIWRGVREVLAASKNRRTRAP